MVFAALLAFGVLLLSGWRSRLARRAAGGLVCLAGAGFATYAVLAGDALDVLIAGTGMLSAGSAALLVGSVPPRFAMAFLVVMGLPWVLAIWTGARLAWAGSEASGVRALLLISGGVLVLYAALIAEEAGRRSTGEAAGAEGRG